MITNQRQNLHGKTNVGTTTNNDEQNLL